MTQELKTIKIKGKDYVMVHSRILAFRKDYPEWSMETEVLHLDTDYCSIRAVIRDDKGVIRATGIAMEKQDEKDMLNNLCYAEVAETSAWGRALACLGIGITEGIASAEEMMTKTKQKPLQPLQTLEDFKEQIKQATDTKRLSALWYQYKVIFADDSPEYKELQELSTNKKKELNGSV